VASNTVKYQVGGSPFGPWSSSSRTVLQTHGGKAVNYALFGHPKYSEQDGLVQSLSYYDYYDQDLALAPDLDTAANLYLGREVLAKGVLGWFGVLDKKRMAGHADRVLTDLKVNIKDASAPVAMLSGGQQQSVAVARAVTWANELVIMDEPTAALGVPQTRAVLELIRRVRDSGRSVVLISHSLPDVMAVSDRIEVLRLGRRVARLTTADTTEETVVGAMTGAFTSEETA
jgi:simple sugar transport system ATP-binding protein